MTMYYMVNATEEMGMTKNYPFIRLFAAAMAYTVEPLTDLNGIFLNWSVASVKALNGNAEDYKIERNGKLVEGMN